MHRTGIAPICFKRQGIALTLALALISQAPVLWSQFVLLYSLRNAEVQRIALQPKLADVADGWPNTNDFT